MDDFAAIDFETANAERTSVCAVGVVVVRGGEVVDSFYSLIKPEPNYYNYWCSRVHGLTCADTETHRYSPTCGLKLSHALKGCQLWHTIKPSTKHACAQ